MTFPEDAAGTFEGRLGCPSELVLDRLLLGELSPASRAEVDAHAAGCEVCRHRIELRTAGSAAQPRDSAARIAAARARARAPEMPAPAGAPGSASPPRGALRRNAWLVWIPICAALGAAAVRLLLRR